jgi:hypothetical protein
VSTPTSDAPEIVTPDVSSITETPVKSPAITPSNTCALCGQQFKHGAVTMLGKNNANSDITIHPECLSKGSDVKSLDLIHVHLDPGKQVSPARQLVIRKRVKALYKAVAIANAKKAQEAGQTTK